MGWEVPAGGRAGQGRRGCEVPCAERKRTGQEEAGLCLSRGLRRSAFSSAGAGEEAQCPGMNLGIHGSPCDNTAGCLPDTHSSAGLNNNPGLHRVAMSQPQVTRFPNLSRS